MPHFELIYAFISKGKVGRGERLVRICSIFFSPFKLSSGDSFRILSNRILLPSRKSSRNEVPQIPATTSCCYS